MDPIISPGPQRKNASTSFRSKKDFEKFQTVIDNETYGKLETKEPELLQQQEEQM